MIIVMKPGSSREEIDHVVKKVEGVGLKAVLLQGTERNVIACLGDKRDIAQDFWNALPGVEKAMPILSPYKMASREVKSTNTEVLLGKFPFGAKKIGVIAGPCAVENKNQLISIAQRVKEAGAVALRGGAFKPRTNPYAFQGLMEEGLEYLAEAREKTGLPVVTEVLSPEHVQMVAKYADVLQIGTRNMGNFVLLKAEYILSRGNTNVILCERGIRTFENHTRFTLSLSAVPYLKQLTHLPIIVDPSHGTGKSSLVNPMSKGAVAVGADGLLIEVHIDPEKALIDGAQTLSTEEFKRLMKELKPLAQAVGRDV